MKRDGFDKIVSTAVGDALGMQIDLIGQGRASDGRFCFARRLKGRCHLCSVSFLK